MNAQRYILSREMQRFSLEMNLLLDKAKRLCYIDAACQTALFPPAVRTLLLRTQF